MVFIGMFLRKKKASLKTTFMGPREIAQRRRVLAPLTEDLGSIPAPTL